MVETYFGILYLFIQLGDIKNDTNADISMNAPKLKFGFKKIVELHLPKTKIRNVYVLHMGCSINWINSLIH